MDPTACLYAAMEQLYEDDKEGAISHLEDLLEWLNAGGYAPKIKKIHSGFSALTVCKPLGGE